MKPPQQYSQCLRWFLLALALTTAGVADLSGRDPSDQQSLSIVSRTNLVLVPVVVDDSAGNHVAGLTKNDFEVVENGKSKSIETFEEVKTTSAPIGRAPTQPGIYSNRLSGDISPERLTIFALDTVNTPFLDQEYARQQLIKFLAQRIDSQEPCALISIQGNGIRILHDFSSDPAVLVAALKKVVGEIPGLTFTGQELEQSRAPRGVTTAVQQPDSGHPGPGLRPPSLLFAKVEQQEVETQAASIDSFVKGSDLSYAVSAERNNTLATLETFQHVAEAFAGVPGRKSLIWVTAAFPFGLDPITGALLAPRVFNQGNTTGVTKLDTTGGLPDLPSSNVIQANENLKSLAPVYERAIQMLNDASISLYPVDARGLVVYFPDATTSQLAGLESFNSALFEASRETMVGFADMTGGRAFYNRNDLDAAFSKAAHDSDTYYLLGYYLDKNPKPGWHKLQVKLKTRGDHVRARNGFFVTPESRQADTRKMDIKLALASPLEYTGLPLSIRWTGSTPAGNKKKVGFQIIIPPSAGIVDESNNNHLNLEVVAVARRADGQPADQYAEHLETDIKPDQMPVLHQEGLNYNSNFQMPPGEFMVSVVIRDNRTGRLGSVKAPLQIAP